jgi:hypothetical protein
MQLMPATAIKVGVPEAELFIPSRNILAGVRLLAALLKHYRGDVVSALVAYKQRPEGSCCCAREWRNARVRRPRPRLLA